MKHTPVSSEDYFSALTTSGLQLADQTLQEDLETLLENGLPVADTVSGLLTIQALQQSQEVTS